MEENQKPHRVSRKDQSGCHWTQGADEEPGKRCRSLAAAAIADCVALCCCPCAVVNLLTLAFVKVPWMIGRRKKINGEDRYHHHHHQQQQRRSETMGDGDGELDEHRFVVESDGSLTKEEEKNEEKRISARVEAERVWLELYQIGHLGFGRLSFTGIHLGPYCRTRT